jgi:hypothetical protein
LECSFVIFPVCFVSFIEGRVAHCPAGFALEAGTPKLLKSGVSAGLGELGQASIFLYSNMQVHCFFPNAIHRSASLRIRFPSTPARGKDYAAHSPTPAEILK